MKKKIDLKYDYILCDSFDALIHFYSIGLSKQIPVITSSPKILSEKKINSIDLYKNWNLDKFKKFQKSILNFTVNVFNTLVQDNRFSREEALLSAICSNRFNNFLLKTSQLNNTLNKKKILFIKISDDYPNSKVINPPWENIFDKKNINIKVYYPKSKDIFFSQTSFLKRIIMAGFETFFFRVISSFSKILSIFLNKKLIIINENELLIEASLRFLFKGYVPISFSLVKTNKSISKINNKKLSLAKNLLSSIITNRVSSFTNRAYKKECLNFFFNQLEEIYKSYQEWLVYFEKKAEYLCINNKKIILFSNHPASPKGLAAKNVFNKKNIKLISFQHGVTAEISGSHNYCLSQHDSSASDEYFAFNNQAVEVAKKNPFNISVHNIYGAPKRYKRQNIISNLFYKYPILFLSNKLYRSNDGAVSIWANDYELYKTESLLVKKVLSKVNKEIFYKPYPSSFDRYLEKDPILDDIERFSNIKIIQNKQDARYLIGSFKLVICCTASSTFSWVIMANTPVVFINFKNIAPLKNNAIPLFKEGLFYFNFDNEKSLHDLKNFLSLPFTKINKLWHDKSSKRKKLIETFVSSNKKIEKSSLF